MKRETSLYLDIVRIVAAGLVFLDHYSDQRLTGGVLWQFGPYGAVAVDLFFVLSGFVIAHVLVTREADPFDFAVSRLARIYSVALPALAFTFAADAIGRLGHAALYLDWPSDDPSHRLWQFVAGALFLNEFAGREVLIGSNGAYWSLGFEVWYYIIFGLICFLPRRWNLLAAALALFAVGAKVAVMFPLWLLGVGLYRVLPRLRPGLERLGLEGLGLEGLGFSAAVALWLGSFALFALTQILLPGRNPLWQPFALDGSRLLDYFYHYVVGLLFALNIAAFDAFCEALRAPLARIAGAVRWLAGASFTFYLFHLPLLNVIAAWSPWARQSTVSRALLMLAVPLGCLAIAQITERRKKFWRAIFARLLGSAGLRRAA